jgi:hypothetical protein
MEGMSESKVGRGRITGLSIWGDERLITTGENSLD